MSTNQMKQVWIGLLLAAVVVFSGCGAERPQAAATPEKAAAAAPDQEPFSDPSVNSEAIGDWAVNVPDLGQNEDLSAADRKTEFALDREWVAQPTIAQPQLPDSIAESTAAPEAAIGRPTALPSFVPRNRTVAGGTAEKLAASEPQVAAMESAAAESSALDIEETAEPSSEQNPTITATPEPDFQTVDVFYGTDRKRLTAPQDAMTLPTKPGLAFVIFLILVAIGCLVFNQPKISIVVGGCAVVLFAVIATHHDDSPNRIGVSYGGERGELVHGIATVTIPNSHQRGLIERPSIFRLEFEEDQSRHVVLAKAHQLNEDEFFSKLSEQVHGSVEPDLLVFVHGFNVDFDSAVRRTAQLSVDLGLGGVPVCYSWPSQGKLTGYTVDENNVIWTEPHLRKFLLDLANQSQARSINIIAHSMGNRAVTAALSRIRVASPPEQLPMFDQIVLAAPDVDADYFRKELAPQLAEVGRHVTLYASSDDRALVASKQLHGGYPRAGESGANLVVLPYLETIDVSGIDLSLLGHSYYGNSESILRDLYDVVRNRLPASQRSGLISKTRQNTPYWMLQTPQVSELNNLETR